MQPLPIVELKISTQARDGLRHGFVITDVDVFVFDASPEPLNEDVVQLSLLKILSAWERFYLALDITKIKKGNLTC